MSSPYELVLKGNAINFAPSNEVEEILQNVRTICTTAKFSVPMDRALGIDGSLIDEPVNTVRGRYIHSLLSEGGDNLRSLNFCSLLSLPSTH